MISTTLITTRCRNIQQMRRGLRFPTILLVCLTTVTVVDFARPGRVYADLPLLIDLASQSPSVSITGAANGDRSGFSITTGDINADGRSELIVLSYWAHWESPGGERTGEIDVIWGLGFPQSGNLSLAQDSPAFSRILGGPTQAYNSRISGGDFNGDGNFDIIWGQPYGPAQDFSSGDGLAYVIFGSDVFPDTIDIASSPPQVTTIFGALSEHGFLGLASCACDLNGDGRDEMVISAPASNQARVFVIWGAPSFPLSMNLTQIPPGVTRITDSASFTELGRNLACADFNDDGFDDLAMSSSASSNPRKVSVLYGRSQFPASISFPNVGGRLTRIYSSAAIGTALAAGDFNGDTEADLAIANPDADPMGCRDCGEVYLLLSAGDLPDSLWIQDGNPVTIIGAGKYTYYGTELGMADISSDGRDELIVVGLGDYTSPTSVDQTVVIYGSTSPPPTIPIANNPTITRIRGPAHGVDLGRGITADDFSGDGNFDLALGAPYFQGNKGRTYVFFGTDPPTDASARIRSPVTLRQNYPNPFNPRTTIEYVTPRANRVYLAIHDVTGSLVTVLIDEEQSSGGHIVRWDGTNLLGQPVASGTYFLRLVFENYVTTSKLVLVR